MPLVKLMKHEVVEREFFPQNEILLMIPFPLVPPMTFVIVVVVLNSQETSQ